ncbi:cytochrome P450 [Trametes gibbosa]|nr:cytochrome P450 [Trametes gibbosa]
MLQVIVSILVAICLVHWRIPCRANPKEHSPPGPRPRPIIGNLFDLTLKEFWLRVASWAQEYGNVIHLRLFNQDLVFLSSIETAVDLLEKRGAVYADRLQTTMASELCGVSKIIAFTSYNHPNYQRERRMMHHALAPAKMQTYHPLMTDETSKFLKTMLDSPENYVHNIKRFTGSQIMSIVYGYEVTKDDEPYLKTAEEILFVLSNHIMPVDNNVWLVDIFPWLKHIPLWFPGSGFKSKAGAWREKMEQCANEPFEWVKERMRSGTATPCYCTGLLTEGEQDAYDAGMADPQHERSIRWTANSFYIASVDTVPAADVCTNRTLLADYRYSRRLSY